MEPVNYPHTVAQIEGRFDDQRRLYVRFGFLLADGTAAYFQGPRGEWFWVRTHGRTNQEVQLRVQNFMERVLERVFGLTDTVMNEVGRN
jgi:hypothetical protein